MNSISTAQQEETQQNKTLVEKASHGDSPAFDKLITIYRPRLRNIVRKMVGHPEDTDDIVQETLLKASQAIKDFKGNSSFGTWLCAIGINTAKDFLKKEKPWRTRAQVIYGNACHDNEELLSEVFQSINSQDFVFDAHEHIAYCWGCVARTLPAEQNATLVYREFLGLTNREGAKQMGLSESVFRHHLADARKHMQTNFDDLCALINKKGVCYQCVSLREGCPKERQGGPVPENFDLEERIKFVEHAELDQGKSQTMHDVFYRRTKQLELEDYGDANETSKCYQQE